jgi:hypothetical protein
MSDDSKEITYNSALERLIAEEAERCAGLSWLHGKAEAYFSIRNTCITLPTIVLSTLVGFLSGSSSSIFNEPTMASIGIGSVSLFTGVISTVGNYFAFAKRTEAHRIAAIQYSKLSRFLSIELTLPKSERIAAKDVLKITKDSIERLLETSPAIPESIIHSYKHHFKDYTDVAHPDITNGLRKVYINSKPAATPLPTPMATAPSAPILPPILEA